MKFSILIAHYNNAKYFVDCFNSIQKQSYENWEAIILDDCSKEEEKIQVKALISNDSRFKFYENEENKGVGFTKKKLIDLAEGEICGFVDPDDAILPNAIENAITEFQKDEKTVLAYSRFVSCDEHLNPIKVFSAAKQVQNNDPYFFNFPIQISHFVTFRKNAYEHTEKMNSQLKIAEDQDLYLKLYEKGKVKFINQANYLYRSHAGGISQNDNKKKSYEFWGEAIYYAMKRRGLQKINGVSVPEIFSNSEEIFKLLEYQNSFSYRLQKKLKTLFQNIL